MRKKIVFILILAIFIGINIPLLKAAENTKSVIYFYSSTCPTCATTEKYLEEKEKSGEIFLLKFEDTKYPNLRKDFDTHYNVDSTLIGEVPMVFIGNQYIGGNAIIANFDSVYKSINEKDNNAAVNFLLDSKSYAKDAANNKIEEETQIPGSSLKRALSICLLILSIVSLLIIFIPKKKKISNKN